MVHRFGCFDDSNMRAAFSAVNALCIIYFWFRIDLGMPAAYPRNMAKVNIVSRLRAFLGETQTEFAERFGVNQSTVCRWEAGEEPSGPALVLLNHLERERLAKLKKAELRAAG